MSKLLTLKEFFHGFFVGAALFERWYSLVKNKNCHCLDIKNFWFDLGWYSRGCPGARNRNINLLEDIQYTFPIETEKYLEAQEKLKKLLLLVKQKDN